MADLIKKITEDKDAKTKQQLELLKSAARAKLSGFELVLKEQFRNPDAEKKVAVVGNRAVFWNQQYRINTSSGVSDAINGMIDQFFTGTDQSLKAGFQNMVKIGLQSLLGNAQAGELQDEKFFIVPEYNAFVRVDVKMWRYNFTSTGIISDIEDAFCFVFCKSIVDHSTLSIDELIYFVSQMFGTSLNLPETKKYLTEIEELWDLLSSKSPQKTLDDYVTTRHEHLLQLREIRRQRQSQKPAA